MNGELDFCNILQIELYNSVHMVCYLVVVTVTMVALFNLSKHCERTLKEHGPKSPEYEVCS